MKRKISNQFFTNYLIVFVISIIAAIFALALLRFADSVISNTLVKNKYTAESVMQDDYRKIDMTPITEHGGGIQIVTENLEIVLSGGLNVVGNGILTTEEFTDFLIQSKSKGLAYNMDIQYNEKEKFWLIVTFPTSIRIDFDIAHNKDIPSEDKQNVIGAIAAVVMFYFILLTICTMAYSKLTAVRITNPLKKLSAGTRQLRNGEYTTRVHLNLKNEFAELQDTFNAMAEQIEHEISLRKQSEENRKKLILDISHDLKNPLSIISGYSELCLKNQESADKELADYLSIVYDNSLRANKLLTNLFELSKLESAEFQLKKSHEDICEYIRENMSNTLSALDNAGFTYKFDIPEQEIFTMIDKEQLNRVFANLVDNVIKYNDRGTNVSVHVQKEDSHAVIIFKDNGVGIPDYLAKDVFNPFMRADASRNSQTGGTGLGLSIVHMIVQKHGGEISLKADSAVGSEFEIRIPAI